MRMVAFFEVNLDKIENYITTWNQRRPTSKQLKVIIPPSTLPEPCNGITGFTVFEVKGAL